MTLGEFHSWQAFIRVRAAMAAAPPKPPLPELATMDRDQIAAVFGSTRG